MSSNLIVKCKYILLLFLIFSAPIIAFSQRVITGTVTDESTKDALIGVNVLIKGTDIGTVTDLNGFYSITLNEQGENTLIFSYVGYTSQTIVVEASNVINVSLATGVLLDQVVVVGYGTIKKEDATGSLQSVDAKDFNRGFITGPQELLAGKVAGVTISTEGGPGSSSKIRIRGESSLSASNDPLIIIDGVPLDNSEISGSRNVLNILNPNDIESMTVLKDASATAIYGNRASAGVILITTKKGHLGGGLNIGYNGSVSSGQTYNRVDVLKADEYRNIIAQQYDETHPARGLLGDANTDWQDQIYRNAVGYDQNLHVSGGIGNVPYRVSVGYSNKDGILKTDNFNRLTGSVNANPKFLDNRLQINLHAKAMRTKNQFANRDAIGAASRFDPTQPIYDPSSAYGGYRTWIIEANGNPNNLAPSNPVALLDQKDDQSTLNRYITNASVDYRFKFLPALRANLNLAYDLSDANGSVFIDTIAAFAFDEINGGGVNNVYHQKKINSLLESYLNYKSNIDKHNIDLMAGYSWQHFEVFKTFKNSNVAGSPAETNEGSDPKEYFLVSLFGRLNYNYDEKYLFTFTLRRDGTSRFSPESRWGVFPAAAFAVKLIENENDFFNGLKLRTGWGVTGQQEINDYYAYLARYQSSFDNARYQFGNKYITTIRPNGYDANIRWEETTTYNVGLDFSLVRNRLSGSLDVYQRNTKDLLNEIPVPAGTNLTNFITSNVGDMENKGVEVSLNAIPYQNKSNFWEFAINVAYNDSKITKLLATDDPNYKGVLVGGIAGGVGSNIQIHSVGYSPSSFYVYEQLFDENGQILEGEFADRNGDGEINEEDKYRYKNPAADYTYGFTSNLKLADFTFSFAGRASMGNYVYNNIQTDQGYLLRLFGTTNVLQNINRSAIENNVEKQSNLTFSDFFVQEASFLKIDHITLSYDLHKILGYGLRVYATVQNPLVFTNYVGLDPEATNGIDNNLYPKARSFVFGVSANFSQPVKK